MVGSGGRSDNLLSIRLNPLGSMRGGAVREARITLGNKIREG